MRDTPFQFLFVFVVLLSFTKANTDTTWPCHFNFDGYVYDLTPGNVNPQGFSGAWQTSDSDDNDYYFKLCDPTTKAPGSRVSCAPGTQVCEQDMFFNVFSCGTNPTTSSYGAPGTGVVMHATNGDADFCKSGGGRQSYLQVLCPTDEHSSGTFGPVTEPEECVSVIPFYHNVGCPVQTPIVIDALISLYKSTDGPNWKNNTNWLSESDPTGCSWHGVHCDFDVITGLSLDKNELSGKLPSDLSTLTNLQNLSLSGNLLSGSFPNFVTSLPSLEKFDLHSNKLSGVIPFDVCTMNSFNIKDNAWECPLPSCCDKTPSQQCGACQ